MKHILIGSTAIKHWFPDFTREPSDKDYIGVGKNVRNENLKIEYHTNDIFLNYENEIMLPNDLLTLKASHLFWDINWDKHMYDVQFLLKKGCKIDKELFYRLYDYWNTIHGSNKRSKLNMSSEDFFNNALKSEYNHDYIHTFLKNPPTYTKVLKDGAEVDVSETKFNNLSFEEKCDLVKEEVMVMAFERYSKFYFRNAYAKMMKKFIISHAPMWEAIFIIENYMSVYKPDYNFLKKIEKSLSELKQIETVNE